MKRGEIWRTTTRQLVVVVSPDALSQVPVRLVVPLTTWDESAASCCWIVQIEPSPGNGLQLSLAANALYTKCICTRLLSDRVGVASVQEMTDLAAAVALMVGYRGG